MSPPTWKSWYGQPKPQSVTYTRSIVSYLDILGFRGSIRTRTAGEISRITRILAESITPHPTDEPATITFTKFSDTVIRSMPELSPAYFIYELKSILRAQVALIPEGVTIRGVVTIGDIVQSWDVVYGPAVVRAYDLERPKGGPPLILIDHEALNLLHPALDRSSLASWDPGLVTCEGTKLYLDYLGACESELRQDQEYLQFLKIHRDFIRQCLDRTEEKQEVRQKYQFLKSYHEKVLQQKFGINIPSYLKV